MIRVNLLPIKEARRRSAGRLQLLVFGIVLVAEVAAFVFLYMAASSDREAVAGEVKETREKVAAIEKEVEEAKNYEKQADQLSKKLKVLDRIERKSAGPVNMLKELQDILSPPENVEERYAQSKMDWNVEWNPSHLWIEELEESGGSFELLGQAMDADDVAEFLHRLETASHFKGVQLDYVRPSKNKAMAGSPVVEFSIHGEISYNVNQDDSSKGS